MSKHTPGPWTLEFRKSVVSCTSNCRQGRDCSCIPDFVIEQWSDKPPVSHEFVVEVLVYATVLFLLVSGLLWATVANWPLIVAAFRQVTS